MSTILERRLYRVFQIGILLKALDGAIEIIGGLFFLGITPSQMNTFMVWVTRKELSEDPNDLVAQSLVHLAAQSTISNTQFATAYLLTHGIVKIFIVVNLLRNKVWAYPFSLVVLSLFTVYQLYRLTYDFAWWLVALTIFDMCIVWLVWHEYILIKSRTAS